IEPGGLPACDLAVARIAAEVELAVQLARRLVGDEMQRAFWRIAQPFGRLEPGGMAGTVVIAEAGDALREQLDAAGRRRQGIAFGIGAEIGEQRLGRNAALEAELALFPE